ncbi:alpha/beta-hydrolase [Clavulina sp. PMI_390]|nr:alpha/beta-hydrolase [Clavulina sp. PMI_390]
MSTIFEESTTRIPSATPGWELEAWQFVPSSSTSSQPPVIIMAHGLGLTKSASLRAPAERFAAEGFGVIVFDFRRFGGSAYRLLRGFKDHELAAVIAQNAFADGIVSSLSISQLGVLRTMPFALYDLFRSFLPWYQPTYLKNGAPPGGLSYVSEPGYDDGIRRISNDAPDFPNEMQAYGFLAIPLYRPVAVAHKITCPLLVTVAKEDNVTPASAALKAASRAPLGESVRFEGVCHSRATVLMMLLSIELTITTTRGGATYEAGLKEQINFLHRVFEATTNDQVV